MIQWGAQPVGAVLPFVFASYDGATGASEAISGLATTDIEVYKGTSMTQRASDNGYALLDTDGIDIDSIVGINGFSIDTGDNSDAGFYAAGSYYIVVVASITADGQTVNFIAGTFRLVPAESQAGVSKVDLSHWKGTAPANLTDTDKVSVSVQHMADAVITAAKFAADAITAAKVAADVGTEIADALLGRNIAGGSSAGRTVTSALRRLRNRVAIASGTGTVYAEDDSTPDHTFAVTTAAGAPIIETDPS